MSYYENARPEMLEFIPEFAMKILDCGCGAGVFGETLKKPEREIWGLEYVKEAADQAAKRLHKVFQGDAMEKIGELPDKYFDCIVCNDVLEHLVDPWEFLRRARRVLAPGGVIVSSIPNMRNFQVLKQLLYGRDWRYEDSGILDRTHLRWFTRKGMVRLFEETGYSVARLQGISRTKSLRPLFLNILTCGGFGEDTRYLQFAVVTAPVSG